MTFFAHNTTSVLSELLTLLVLEAINLPPPAWLPCNAIQAIKKQHFIQTIYSKRSFIIALRMTVQNSETNEKTS